MMGGSLGRSRMTSRAAGIGVEIWRESRRQWGNELASGQGLGTTPCKVAWTGGQGLWTIGEEEGSLAFSLSRLRHRSRPAIFTFLSPTSQPEHRSTSYTMALWTWSPCQTTSTLEAHGLLHTYKARQNINTQDRSWFLTWLWMCNHKLQWAPCRGSSLSVSADPFLVFTDLAWHRRTVIRTWCWSLIACTVQHCLPFSFLAFEQKQVTLWVREPSVSIHSQLSIQRQLSLSNLSTCKSGFSLKSICRQSLSLSNFLEDTSKNNTILKSLQSIEGQRLEWHHLLWTDHKDRVVPSDRVVRVAILLCKRQVWSGPAGGPCRVWGTSRTPHSNDTMTFNQSPQTQL